MIKISLFTDEISADPETAIELGTSWGIRNFELRGFFTDRVPCFSAYQKQRLQEILAEYQAQIVAVGPGLFKVPLPPEQAERASLAWLDYGMYESWSTARRVVYQHLEELLPRSLDYANELGAGKVVIFGFDRAGAPAGKPPEAALEILRRAAEMTQAAGLELALENEAGFWGDTGARTAEMVRSVNHPCLGINWDPGNAFFAGDCPFPDGYEQVRSLVCHVHFKDARIGTSGKPEYVLQGQIDWPGQMRALQADGYDGYISVETHTRPRVATSRSLLGRLQALLAEQSGSAEESSVIQKGDKNGNA